MWIFEFKFWKQLLWRPLLKYLGAVWSALQVSQLFFSFLPTRVQEILSYVTLQVFIFGILVILFLASSWGAYEFWAEKNKLHSFLDYSKTYLGDVVVFLRDEPVIRREEFTNGANIFIRFHMFNGSLFAINFDRGIRGNARWAKGELQKPPELIGQQGNFSYGQEFWLELKQWIDKETKEQLRVSDIELDFTQVGMRVNAVDAADVREHCVKIPNVKILCT